MYSPFRIIIITGPKHSGKTLCSLALGELTGWDVVDLDEEVKKQTGKPPRDLFIEGPEVFKKAEAMALASLIRLQEATSERSRLIIAAGGGLIDNSEAIAMLSDRCRTIPVYLDISPRTAWQRILADGELPPFLATKNPRETHFALHTRRAKAYKAFASLTVSVEGKDPDEIALEIMKRLNV